ncbi:MAG: cyclophilin-like fold protein, partial [Nitrospirota bacterium]|nr:cyclophilin-like fold protein [Nitrospirota bacterium]
MPARIKITVKDVVLDAELSDTETAKAIAEALPVETVPNEWGDEFYFEVPVRMPLDETATTKVAAGDIGYWPPGNALAIFFGPTPMSRGPEPVPASAVNRVGRITGDAML